MTAKVDSWDEALDVAEEFMAEFSREIETVPADEVEATHRATEGDHDAAEQILTTEIAAEALADAAGYSDELLLDIISQLTNDQHRLVAHRDGSTITTVAGESDALSDGVSLRTLHAVFPLDGAGIERVIDEGKPIMSVMHLRDSTIYRFLFDDARETDIVLPRGTQVTSPEFETTVANILEEKWGE